MKKRIDRTLLNILLGSALFLAVGCNQIRYHTLHEGVQDPMYQLDNSQTVGLTTFYWTSLGRELRIDELLEKKLLVLCRTELENRGFKVEYIAPSNLREVEVDGIDAVAVHTHGLDKFPDMALTVHFGVTREKVKVPSQSYGSLSANQYGASGWAGSQGSYDVTTYALHITAILWSGAPEYMEQVWRGSITQGSPKADLAEQASRLVETLFNEEFPIKL